MLADGVNEALLVNDEPEADRLVRAFQDRTHARIDANFETAAVDEKLHRRLLAQIGTRRPGEDAATLRCILKNRDALELLASRLPLRIGNLSNEALDEYKTLIERTSGRDREFFYARCSC
ncbi:MAG: hypothetical protein WDN48_04205 [Pseudolabrys sp.]